MNYYNPYFYTIPNVATTPKVGFLGRVFGRSGITLSNILNGTQKALNFANQAIPLVKQVRPMIGNAKTMFKVMNEFKKTENQSKSKNIKTQNYENKNNNNIDIDETTEDINSIKTNNNTGPTFFI